MSNRRKPLGTTEETLLTRYEETKARLQKIKSADFIVVSIWECQCRKLLRKNRDLENELSLRPYLKNYPLNIRDALYGDRTEATKTYYRIKQGRKSTMWM